MDVEEEIQDLQRRLEDARARLSARKDSPGQAKRREAELPIFVAADDRANSLRHLRPSGQVVEADYLHNLILLSDSALPLGSFAFSSGLESFLAHSPKNTHTHTTLSCFLALSMASLATTTLCYVVAGFEHAEDLETLDNDLDASITCVVAKRASSKQGKALLAIWERSLRSHVLRQRGNSSQEAIVARSALEGFSTAVKTQNAVGLDAVAPVSNESGTISGHLPPLFGATCAALSIPLLQTLYVYLFNHARTVVSAAIRSSLLGPYQAQSLLASETLKSSVWSLVEEEIGADGLKKRRPLEEAGQSVPMLDLWGGRHEIIYSRIFNS